MTEILREEMRVALVRVQDRAAAVERGQTTFEDLKNDIAVLAQCMLVLVAEKGSK